MYLNRRTKGKKVLEKNPMKCPEIWEMSWVERLRNTKTGCEYKFTESLLPSLDSILCYGFKHVYF